MKDNQLLLWGLILFDVLLAVAGGIVWFLYLNTRDRVKKLEERMDGVVGKVKELMSDIKKLNIE